MARLPGPPVTEDNFFQPNLLVVWVVWAMWHIPPSSGQTTKVMHRAGST